MTKPPLRAQGCGCGIFPAGLLWIAIELLLLVELARAFGGPPVVAVFLGTSFVGLLLLRAGGLSMMVALVGWGRRVQATGQVEELPVAGAVPRLTAGALLLLPGFLTDLAGLAVLLPPLRGMLVRRAQRLFEEQHRQAMRRAGRAHMAGPTIEGEVVRSEDARAGEPPEPDDDDDASPRAPRLLPPGGP